MEVTDFTEANFFNWSHDNIFRLIHRLNSVDSIKHFVVE